MMITGLAKPDDRYEFKVMSTDYKESLANHYPDDYKDMKRHAKKHGGVMLELPVTTADSNVYYAGPAGIEEWIADRCAFTVFFDVEFWMDPDMEVYTWYFVDGDVVVGVGVNSVEHYMTYSDWCDLNPYWWVEEDEHHVAPQEVVDRNAEFLLQHKDVIPFGLAAQLLPKKFRDKVLKTRDSGIMDSHSDMVVSFDVFKEHLKGAVVVSRAITGDASREFVSRVDATEAAPRLSEEVGRVKSITDGILRKSGRR